MSTKYKDTVAFGKVDVDDNADAAVEFEITSVPTFIAFDGEEPIARFSGADPGQLETVVKDLEKK
jgi:thioredoxin-like negative regulator of GroEL